MRRAVLGVTGGVAAFKACDLVSLLRERDVETRVVMTPAAACFIQPLTFAALTGHRVLLDELRGDPDPSIPHVAWGRWAEIVVVAPATADFLGRLAHGLANDALTSLMLAFDATRPVVLAPAMNCHMWNNELVRENIERLRLVAGGSRHLFVEPVEKRLACGDRGMGALAAPEQIAATVLAALEKVPPSVPGQA